ncbi:CPCC family cysteine-rich protein [Amaricoccus tamworthensis]|uniref:CPCC family cysteine-rich protein n=1 Tax=Amaricoccus tamworthensis TaxID=57002 RepID=UPI003C7BE687
MNYEFELPLLNCPCCKLPTLRERGKFELCMVCWWEDDGQDDAQADEVWGGPNGDYSLTKARKNYQHHGHMYDGEDRIRHEENSNAVQQAIDRYVALIRSGECELDPLHLRQLIGE